MSGIYITPALDTGSPKQGYVYGVVADKPYDVFGRQVLVPAGFEFDGASIPPILWPIIGNPFDPKFCRAALLHDWLYSSHLIDRRAADKAFLAALIEDGVNEWRAQAMYSAVRAGGLTSWDDSEQDVAYMAWLRERIVADGRNLSDYGLIA
jgi:hypothetical protein